jgi:hypothetical protein
MPLYFDSSIVLAMANAIQQAEQATGSTARITDAVRSPQTQAHPRSFTEYAGHEKNRTAAGRNADRPAH